MGVPTSYALFHHYSSYLGGSNCSLPNVKKWLSSWLFLILLNCTAFHARCLHFLSSLIVLNSDFDKLFKTDRQNNTIPSKMISFRHHFITFPSLFLLEFDASTKVKTFFDCNH